VKPALPDEGAWQTLVSLHGQPAIRVAFLRPDPEHTGYLVGVVWLDQNLVKLVLHPGYQQPGGTGWSQPDEVPTSERSSLLATFNSGFRLQDADGGYWADGKTAAPLRQGAASMVFYKDGHVDIVKWGTAPPGPDVAAVRQNLVLLVDHGVVSPLVDDPTTAVWGTTFTTRFYVWRTALGIRADGSLVFVIGPALNVGTLARVIHAAGAVRAIELDINPSWTYFMTYTHPSRGVAVPHLLTKDELSDPYRYLQPSSRDFVAVLAR
jgi:Phosphodiester glycosidase